MNITKKNKIQPKIIKLDKFRQNVQQNVYRNQQNIPYNCQNEFITFKDESVKDNNRKENNNEVKVIQTDMKKLSSELCKIEKEKDTNFYLVRSKSISYIDSTNNKTKTPIKNTKQINNNQNFYYKSNFYIEIPQEKVIKPQSIQNYSFKSGRTDGGRVNLYNFKYKYGEGKNKAIKENDTNLTWNENNTPCKINNYEYIGSSPKSVNESPTQSNLEITENSRFDIEPKFRTCESNKHMLNLKSVRANQFGYEGNYLTKSSSSLLKLKKEDLVNGKQSISIENEPEPKTLTNYKPYESSDTNINGIQTNKQKKVKKSFYPSFLKHENNSTIVMYNEFACRANLLKKTKSDFLLRTKCRYKSTIHSYYTSNDKSVQLKTSNIEIKKKDLPNYSSIVLPPNEFYCDNPCTILSHLKTYQHKDNSVIY